MDVYKKMFKYVPESKVNGYISIIMSAISAFVLVYGYYLMFECLNELIVNANFEIIPTSPATRDDTSTIFLPTLLYNLPILSFFSSLRLNTSLSALSKPCTTFIYESLPEN